MKGKTMENQTTQTETKQPELSLADLQNLRTLIEVTVRRGAFQASELSGVGAVFDKLNNFLVSVSPPKTEETTAPQTDETTIKAE